jgi:hypothetical protein
MTTAEADRLLDMADRILSGAVALPRGSGVRVAAVLARSALEDIVAELCAERGHDVSGTNMRVKLAILVALEAPHAGNAAMCWSGLSRACHQHAYEIAPHRGEIVGHVKRIREVGSAMTGGRRVVRQDS